jgi:HAE1 family hydrophobic/amphiphilic exporter-1
MSRFAIRYPYLIIVVCLITCIIGVAALFKLPVDLFPAIRMPVVVVATFYSGMPPEQIETSITGRFERFFTLASGIDHIESRSLAGVSLIKIYFQPGSDPDTAVSTIANLASANLRRLPPGTLPPVVLKFDASSLPVCLITLKGDGLSETQLRDAGQYAVRNQVAGVLGASVPQPFGGKYRQIMVYVDPAKLEAHQLSVMDVVRSVNDSNLILPAGEVRIGPYNYNLYANSQLRNIEEVNTIPLKTVDGRSVAVGDIGDARDAAQIQGNIVRVDSQRSVYLPVLKQGGEANTIAVVDGIRNALRELSEVPSNLLAKVVFDQSVFVKSAITNLIHEGGIGLVLTGLMIFLFLSNIRATAAVFLSIPLSVLATFLALQLSGSTLNTMVLGGLALVFSRLIDNSVVVLENIYRHLESGLSAVESAAKGGTEMALPVLAATLTTAVVFLPVTMLSGVSKFLFSALGLTVVLSLAASYVVALTVVPLFCARFISDAHKEEEGQNRVSKCFNLAFRSALSKYENLLTKALEYPRRTVISVMLCFIASLALFPFVGIAYFPRTDPGQFVINIKAPTGTRVEITEAIVAKVEKIVQEVVDPSDLGVVVSNIGVQPGFSSIYTSNSGQHTAFIQASLTQGHRVGSYEYIKRVRSRIVEEVPEIVAYFQSGGLVDSILNLGLPAPIDLQIIGADLQAMSTLAGVIADKIKAVSGVSDVLVPQDVDQPAYLLEIDREKAAALGLTSKEIMQNVITALTSGGMVAPSYFVDPKNGNDYLLTVQYPEGKIQDLTGLMSIPIRGANMRQTVRLDSVAKINAKAAPVEVSHYQLRRVIDVFVAPVSEDLGSVLPEVKRTLNQITLPVGIKVSIRGMAQGMEESFRSFGVGLVLATVLVYLILVAQFQSWIDPFLILLAVPMGLSGVLLILVLTQTTLNVMSLMGVVMMVGIVVSNSILIVEFIRKLRMDGVPLRDAVLQASKTRLRPVLMTSLATLIGLLPMALKLGTGSEAYAPLARAIIGGLGVSLVFTVFLVPSAYLWVHGTGAVYPLGESNKKASNLGAGFSS